MTEPRCYTIEVTIRTEMWLKEATVYTDEGWIQPDFADLVLRELDRDMAERWIRPQDITHISLKEITYALG